MITRLLMFISLAIALGASAFAQTFDVVQTENTSLVDYGGIWGQTFTPTQTGPLVGVRLLVRARQRSATDPYGSAFTVKVHEVISGVIQSTPVASGSFDKATLILNQAVNADVYFTTPYTQTAGKTLSLVVESTSGGGANGWNDYGISNANPYSGGGRFSSFTSTAPVAVSSMIDLTFSTVTVVPRFIAGSLEIEPRGNAFSVTLSESESGDSYRLEQSEDLIKWTPLSTRFATGAPLVWSVPGGKPKIFYRVVRL